jgi:hypothetical protein
MIRTVEENRKWWDEMSVPAKARLFGDLIDGASESVQSFLASIESQHESGATLSDKQVAALRSFQDQM